MSLVAFLLFAAGCNRQSATVFYRHGSRCLKGDSCQLLGIRALVLVRKVLGHHARACKLTAMTQPLLTISLHDSEVSSIDVANGEAFVRFSAARVVGASSAYLGAVELLVVGVSAASRTQGCLGRLADGEVRMDGTCLASLPVPIERQGAITLALVFANGSEFEATGRGLRLRVRGEPVSIEHLHC